MERSSECERVDGETLAMPLHELWRFRRMRSDGGARRATRLNLKVVLEALSDINEPFDRADKPES